MNEARDVTGSVEQSVARTGSTEQQPIVKSSAPISSDPILVADDNPVDRMILAKIVRDQGYTVVEAGDGAEALEQYREKKPQLVLLDALMPKLDGFQVAKAIKEEAGDTYTPIIFLTALTEAEQLARCLDAGGDDFLTKPYNNLILHAKLDAVRRVRDLHQTMQQQRDAITRNNQRLIQEQEAAKLIFDRIAHREFLDTDFVRYLMSPIALFNGDVLLAAPTPRRTFTLLLGDFTGHGLTASVGAMPLADSFYTLTQRGLSLADIAQECNRKLHSVLPPGYFCCALIAEFNFEKGTIEYWSGGLPAGYLLAEPETGRQLATQDWPVRELPSEHLPLGILSADRFSSETQHLTVRPGERLVLCTDGIVEAADEGGRQFGERKTLQVLRQAAADSASSVARIQQALDQHCGSGASDDDVTAVELTILPPGKLELAPLHPDLELETSPDSWRLSYTVEDESLLTFTPFPLLQRLLLCSPGLRPRMSDIGMVMTELYSNALEHGVLGLDSALKHSAEGFAKYYLARTERLKSARGFVRFDLHCRAIAKQLRLEMKVTDSGAGFAAPAAFVKDHRNQQPNAGAAGDTANPHSAFHGRGLRLLTQVCERVEYSNQGRTTSVEMVCKIND